MVALGKLWRVARTTLLIALIGAARLPGTASAASPAQPPGDEQPQEVTCAQDFLPVSTALTDLGADEYIRMDGAHTGFSGGLYPQGSNIPPVEHAAAGERIARRIIPLDVNGQPDPQAGKVVIISVGMSNAGMEFATFRLQAQAQADINPHLVLVNGAQAGQTAEYWLDPAARTWQVVNERLTSAGVTPLQVQVVWLKQTRTGSGDFPQKAQTLQTDLTTIVQNLKTLFPNVQMVFLSSRTRSYTYWNGLSPEPAAFETGFAVKWLIEAQINGDPALNYDPARGEVRAPYLLWSAYLWADGANPRRDGFSWQPEDMVPDCTHPSNAGRAKIASLLLAFFRSDPAATPWFLNMSHFYLPLVARP
ncbi:MAG: hypothetical protein ROW48_17465 [Bellilinea sp.]|jgi:hypothetical protein